MLFNEEEIQRQFDQSPPTSKEAEIYAKNFNTGISNGKNEAVNTFLIRALERKRLETGFISIPLEKMSAVSAEPYAKFIKSHDNRLRLQYGLCYGKNAYRDRLLTSLVVL